MRDHVLSVGDDGKGESVEFEGKKIRDNEEVGALESVLQDLLGAAVSMGKGKEREIKMLG